MKKILLILSLYTTINCMEGNDHNPKMDVNFVLNASRDRIEPLETKRQKLHENFDAWMRTLQALLHNDTLYPEKALRYIGIGTELNQWFTNQLENIDREIANIQNSV